jgi:3-deoxy-7-phosphoheptulonate synthase
VSRRKVNDLHIREITPLIAPEELKRRYPIGDEAIELVYRSRETIKEIIRGEDPRILAVIGPCSIHDAGAALEYAERLRSLAERVSETMYVVMRVYFEKPRTVLGWRGMIVDPYMDGSYDIAHGLASARDLLLRITAMGLPAGSEMLDPIVPQYIDDLVSWAAIGARTTESQTHRNLASGLSMPVGFKNSTSGNFEMAINAMQSAMHPASFIGIDQGGNTCILHTTGNEASHLILRGGKSGPNYHEEHVEEAEEAMEAAGLSPSLIIDCSHANSGKKQVRQQRVLRSLTDQLTRGRRVISGFMLESNLFEGRQEIPEKLSELRYGVSVTDACIGWEETERIVLESHQALLRSRSVGRT